MINWSVFVKFLQTNCVDLVGSTLYRWFYLVEELIGHNVEIEDLSEHNLQITFLAIQDESTGMFEH